MRIRAKLFEQLALHQSLQTIGRATDGGPRKPFNWPKTFRVLLLNNDKTR